VFSSQSLIQIGGLVDSKALARFKKGGPTPNITRAFVGQMQGFYFNDVRVFNIAATTGEKNSKNAQNYVIGCA